MPVGAETPHGAMCWLSAGACGSGSINQAIAVPLREGLMQFLSRRGVRDVLGMWPAPSATDGLAAAPCVREIPPEVRLLELA